MDIENRIRRLEQRYRAAFSSAVAAKAHYMALAGEPSSSAIAVKRADEQWTQWEARKKTLVAQMDSLERLETEMAG